MCVGVLGEFVGLQSVLHFVEATELGSKRLKQFYRHPN